MKKLLYITANPKGLEKSKGLKIGEAFINTVKEENPEMEIKQMDLFTLDIAHMDAELVSGKRKISRLRLYIRSINRR